MFRFLLSAAFAIGFVVACGTEPDSPPDTEHQRIEVAGETATEIERQACAEAGGTIQAAGMLGHEHCIQIFEDAQQPCTDSSQCTGRCTLRAQEVAPVGSTTVVGRCEITDSPFGCIQEVKDSVIQAAICID